MVDTYSFRSFLIHLFLTIFALTGLTGCWEEDSKYPTDPVQMCEGTAPAADVQAGVCAGARKVCAQDAAGAWGWREPDYTAIAGYEATEVSCDGLDNNCDEAFDETFSLGAQCGTTDVGECAYGVTVCSADHTGTECSGNVEPGVELCDGLDNDCDDVVDNGVTTDFYPDADGDTYGDALATPVAACAAPADHVADHTDCNDLDRDVNPAAAELCNGIDDNCSGTPDETFSLGAQCGSTDLGPCEYGITVCTADGAGTECSGNVEPGVESCDGLDNDCDDVVDNGVTTDFYPDADGDTYGDALATPVAACSAPAGHVADHTDCNDDDAAVNPAAAERCNGLDDNCSGTPDETFSLGAQCGATDVGECAFGLTVCTADGTGTECAGDVGPGVEICDGLDNDCVDGIDNGVTTDYYPDTDGDTYGDASATPVAACSAPVGHVTDHTDCDDADGGKNPAAVELCNGLDDNCSGTTDELFVLGTQCGSTDVGACEYGITICTADGAGTECSGSVEPDAESCDGLDNDCDTVIDNGVTINFYPDTDGDTYGDALAAPVPACSAPMGHVANNLDCDDSRNDVYPGAAELCDGLDNDCDSIVDEDLVELAWYPDLDGDTHGDATAAPVMDCSNPGGLVLTHDDCDDAVNAVHPGALEVCNGIDDNCVGGIDEGVKIDFYPDADGDTYGSATAPAVQACSAPAGHVSNHTDCNDAVNAIHPGASEQCNGLDDDCDTIIDEDLVELAWYPDVDGDTFGDALAVPVMNCANPGGMVQDHTDCDDTRAAVHPGAAELCNGLDDNCLGGIDDGLVAPLCEEQDGVCAGSVKVCGGSSGWLACGAANYGATYEVTEATCDGFDNDCDAEIDEGVKTNFYPDADGDTFGSATAPAVLACSAPANHVTTNTDCDDTRAAVHPGAAELCNGLDDDCNVATDDGAAEVWLGAACDGTDADLCNEGTFSCTAGAQACSDPNDVNPEICDGLDNDCDSSTDEGFALGVQCGTTDVGECAYGTTVCRADHTGTECSGNIEPAALDLCDGLDNDCDGTVDAGTCAAHSACADDGDTVDAYCACDAGYFEVPADSGTCVAAREPALGELVVNELLIEPTDTLPALGQYFELHNTTDATLLLSGVGFQVWNGTLLDFEVIPADPAVILLPREYFVVGPNADGGTNGGVAVDYEFLTMPVMTKTTGTVEVYRDRDALTIDEVTWTGAWNHRASRSLVLSRAALDGDAATLNDAASAWCFSDQTELGGTAGDDYGTPGVLNDPCEVNWCNVQWPAATTVEQYLFTEYVYSRVWEDGLTDLVTPAQGPFILSQFGYGTVGSTPDASWDWVTATYNLSDANDDEYMGRVRPYDVGVYDYAYRYSLDGGLSWKLCDLDNSDNGYQIAQAGELTVTPAIPALYFSEYIEGSSTNKAIEIYNPLSTPFNLTGCLIRVNYNNGAVIQTVNLTGTIAARDVFVACHTTVDPAIDAVCDQASGILNWSGNDVVELECSGTKIDIMGQYGTLYNWGVEHTFVRDCWEVHGDTNGTDLFEPLLYWDVFDLDTFTQLGWHTPCVP